MMKSSFIHIYYYHKYVKNKNDKLAALNYMEKSIEIARITILPYDKVKFQNFQRSVDLLRNKPSREGLGIIGLNGNVFCVPDNSDEHDRLLTSFCEELTHISADNIVERIHLLNSIGTIYSRKENYNKALKYFHDAVELYIKNQTSDRFFLEQLEHSMISTYFGISRVYYRQENWTMSLNNLEKALHLALKQKQDDPLLPEIYHAMGLSYSHKLDVFMAIHYLELAISTATKRLPNDDPRVQLYLDHLRQLKPRI